ANQNMLALQEELTSTENKIGFARQAFNDTATAYNNKRDVFPAVMVAGMFGFSEAALLEAAQAEREGPKASFKQPGTRSPRTRYRSPIPLAAATMAMDFFQQQDTARRKTSLLVVYFVLAILALIALVYGLLLALDVYGTGEGVSLWQPELLVV